MASVLTKYAYGAVPPGKTFIVTNSAAWTATIEIAVLVGVALAVLSLINVAYRRSDITVS